MKTFTVGLIGFGFIGKVHALCHSNMPWFYDPCPFNTVIHSVCTSQPESAGKAASFLGNGVIPCTDFRQITENPEIDIVDIASPNDCHLEAVLSAMAHQKHIYCEKPLTGNLGETAKIREALKNYRGISQMTLQYRFLPATLRAKQIIDEGLLGDIHEFRTDFLQSVIYNREYPRMGNLCVGNDFADIVNH